MNNLQLEATEGQLELTMNETAFGKFTLESAGLSEDIYTVKGGNLRLKIDLGYIKDISFYKMPVIEFEYTNNINTSEWIIEFNGTNILEKKDHSGKTTVLLLNRKKMDELKQRHENVVIIHGDFSEEVNIKNTSSFNFLEEPGS